MSRKCISVSIKKVAFIFFLLASVCVNRSYGQSLLKGMVVSNKGSALKGVSISAVALKDGKIFKTNTNVKGAFSFTEFTIGEKYTLYFNLQGYQTDSINNFLIGEGDNNSVLVRLKPIDRKNLVITGLVVDSAGNPLSGVSVQLDANKTGTLTDSLGQYQITIRPDSKSLLFSYVGYEQQEVAIGSQKVVNIGLVQKKSDMNDVVIVGYGTQKKITTVGAQTTVNTEELKLPVAHLSDVLAGHAAGVMGVQRSGEPGYDNADIYIRGISTFTNSSPLVLVDGVQRDLNNIDPEDIASFSILKDASATAVYGVRGANGVIIITTKKGKVGRTAINAQYDEGITQFTKLPQFADGPTYMQISNEAHKNSNPLDNGLIYSEGRIDSTAKGLDPDLYPNVNWFDVILHRAGQNRRARANVSGGSDKAQYYLSLGYYDELGMFRTDKLAEYNSSIRFTRYNFTSNLSVRITKTTKIDFGAQGWISNGNYPGVSTPSVFHNAYVMPPITIPVKYSNGYFSQPRTGDMSNPYNSLTQSGYTNEFNSQLMSNLRVTQELDFITKGLSFTGMFSFDNANKHQIARHKSVDAYLAIRAPRDDEGNLQYEQTAIGTEFLDYNRNNGGSRQFYLESAINYDRTFGKHQVTGMILYNQQDNVDAFAGDFYSSIPYRFMGLAGRVTYAYDNKYLAEANFGYNGSEAFAPAHRFGFFPSYGIGWVASQEKFFNSVKDIISFLKFRFTYGEVGNSSIGGQRFAYISNVAQNINGYSYGANGIDNNISGLNFGYYGVDVTWERSKKFNLGIDIKTLQNSVSLTVDLFRELRRGIFLQRGDVPTWVGILNKPYGNIGAMNNQGIDATLEVNKKLSKDWNLVFKGNITYNHSVDIDDAQAPWPYPWQQRIGRRWGQRFGYIALGLFKSDEEVANSPYQPGDTRAGDIKYKDLNGDGKIDATDQAPIGYGSFPEIIYGFGPTINWKNWSLAAWFKGIDHVDIGLGGDAFQPFIYGLERGNLFSNITDRWTPDNPDTHPFYPRITEGNTNMNYQPSTWWTKSGAFLRMQTIQLNYDIHDKKWMNRIGLSHLNIYFIGYNLATISGFKLWDVELGDGNGAAYPLLKTYNLGVKMMF